MAEVFLRQREAWAFILTIKDPQEKLLTEICLAKALSFLISDPVYQRECIARPLDVLHFITAANAFFRDTQLISKILDGAITSVDDLSPFPREI